MDSKHCLVCWICYTTIHDETWPTTDARYDLEGMMEPKEKDMKKLHDEYHRQVEQTKKLKDEEEEWLKLHTIENNDGA